MTQQTVGFPATQVAEPPLPMSADGDVESVAGDNRRKLMLVGAGAGVLVLAILAFFLLHGGSSSSDSGFVVPHHRAVPKAAAAAPSNPVVKLPKRVVTPVGRDPFKPLYTVPVGGGTGSGSTATAAAGSTSTSGTTSSSTSGSTGSTTTTTTSSTPTYHPVWVQLRSVSGTQAVFAVGFSNGKTLKAVKYTVKAPKSGSRTALASSFALLSIHSGVATLQFGDGTPFRLDKAHSTMVVG